MKHWNCYWKISLGVISVIFLTREIVSVETGNGLKNNNAHHDSEQYHQSNFRSKREVDDSVDAEDSKFKGLVPKDYNLYELPPKINGVPVKMNLTVLLFNVRDIKEVGEEITLELNMQMQWKDERVKPASEIAARNLTDYIILKPSMLQKLWYPDIYIDHVKSVSQPILVSKPASLRIYSDSRIRYSTRLTITTACKFDFHYYPADTQKCHLDIKSYAYTDRDLILNWRQATFAYELEASNFYVGMEGTETFAVKTNSGTYTGLRLTIKLARHLSYHLIQTYLPSFLLVIISWLSFLVPPQSVPGRMAICMTCLLSLIAMFASVRSSVPNVSYVKALDIWMVVCVFFVFLALAEFTIVLKVLSVRPKKKKKVNIKELKETDATIDPSSLTDQAIALNHLNSMRGVRGSVATVYYPGGPQSLLQPSQRHRRPSFPAPPMMSSKDPSDDELSESQENVASSALYDRPNQRFYGRSSIFPPPQGRPSISEHPFNRQPTHTEKPHYERLAKIIEIYSSIITPTLFFAFNFVYWPWLIASSQYFQEDDTTIIYSV